ncbi:MAG: hypothetical protein IPI29_09275 [Ignavibacteria bacterium]|nr:hypothetical protein [Ignavibacteria bacterium]
MKVLALVIVVLGSMHVGRAQQGASEVTQEDRITKHMPVLQPRPCSVWLTKWGASADVVNAEARRIGLKLVDSTSLLDEEATIYTYTEPDEAEIYYCFSVIRGVYSVFTCTLSYNDGSHAKARLDEATKDLQDHWGADGTTRVATARCDQTKGDVEIEVGITSKIVTFTVQSM